jgi:hypothetical protein
VGAWGPSDFDVRHVLSSAVSYDLPGHKQGGILQFFTSDWGSDLLFRYQSALPYSPRSGGFFFLNGSAFSGTKPDLVPGQALYLYGSAFPGGRRANPAAFKAPTNGQGNFPRNGLRAFSASQLDLAVRRQFSINERFKFQFRAEIFNVLNHPNFGGVATFIGDPSFGAATQTLNSAIGGLNALYQMGGPRSGQLSVKLLW